MTPNQRIAALTAQVTSLQKQVTTLNATVVSLKATIVALNAEIAELQAVPVPIPTPTPTGWPDATTTGAKGTLTAYTGNLYSGGPGTIIENKSVSGGAIVITHNNVTVRNCKVNGDHIRVSGADCIVEDCTVISEPGFFTAVYIDTGTRATVRRCDISNFENGVVVGAGVDHIIRDNYFHDVLKYDPVRAPHSDGVQFLGSAGLGTLVEHNNIDLALASAPNADNGVNSCITTGPVVGVKILGNRLNGGGWTIYFDGASGCECRNNMFGGHVYGNVAGTTWLAQTYSGNVDSAGVPITV